MYKKLLLTLNVLVTLWLLVAKICLQVPPQEWWFAGFITFLMPVALVLNFVLVLLWLWYKPFYAAFPLLVMLLLGEYYQRLFALNVASGPVPEGVQTLQVLSYNVRVFNIYGHLRDPDYRSTKEAIKWVAEHPADVYCLQEFYNDPNSDFLNTLNRIGVRYEKEMYMKVALTNHIGAQFGMAIFSRYPVVNNGVISFGDSTHNSAIFADVVVGPDTVRVYNCHLQSMSIEERDIAETAKERSFFEKRGKELMRRLKNGFVSRGIQTQLLLDHFKTCPYPFILTGDFNDLPFSYTYEQLEEVLDNAFTTNGFGIGTTYNGMLPFLRIDNQFYSPGLRNHSYQTHYDIGYSDHFPSSAVYSVSSEQ